MPFMFIRPDMKVSSEYERVSRSTSAQVVANMEDLAGSSSSIMQP